MAAPKKTPQLINAILETIATERISTTEACRKHKLNQNSLMEWIQQDAELGERYARAKGSQLELMADEILSIADDENLDANSRRVRVDSRKWLLSKLKPKKYGDKLNLEHEGSVGVVVNIIDRFGDKK